MGRGPRSLAREPRGARHDFVRPAGKHLVHEELVDGVVAVRAAVAQHGDRVAPITADRRWTIPNALSVLRLLGVPLFLWLLLGPHDDLAALIVLATAGFTDWLDGVLARALDQTSRLGALLDPAADRLYILATLVGLTLRHSIPWWLAAIAIGRDLILAPTVPMLRLGIINTWPW